MKLILLVALIELVLCLDDKIGREEFTRYKLLFKKNYASVTEENLRYQIFALQLDRVAKVNTDYNNGKSLYKVAINQYSDLAYNEFLAQRGGLIITGLKRTLNNQMSNESLNIARQVSSSAFDWRSTGHVTPIKDQENCGACWAFAAAAALETQWSLYYNVKQNLSVQNLIDCVGSNFGCRGGMMNPAYDYVRVNQGINNAIRYPFIGTNRTCSYLKEYPDAKATGFVNIPRGNEAELEKAVRNIGPISVGVMASSDFINYNGGIFTGQDCTDRLNHAVVIVGYNNTNNPPFWIVKNSWGTWWGESGYIRMVKGKNLCGIANLASYPTV